MRLMTARRAGLALLPALALGCGHTIAPGIPFQHAPRFDFRQRPGCDPPSAPPVAPSADTVLVRYLGAGGVLVEWQGAAVLSAPFFTNPGLLRSGLGHLRSDPAAIQRGLLGADLGRVGAIFAGHSHYDHIGDLPEIAAAAPRAALLVNRSGANALEQPFPGLARRLVVLETIEGRSVQLVDARGAALPFRLQAVPSSHAPHFHRIGLWMGTTSPSPRPWPQRHWGNLQAGRTYTFVLDLLDGTGPQARVAFRLFLQDSASAAPDGIPTVAAGEPAYDVAILCVASSQWVKPYPVDLLQRIHPRHVLVTHYENFFRQGPCRGFVPLLRRGIVDGFLRRADATLQAAGVAGSPPVVVPRGPSAPRWTMPLTGEWLVFHANPRRPPATAR